MNLLEVRDLRMEFSVAGKRIRAVDGVTLDVGRQETFALLGESGCGKSMTALSIMRLLPDNGRIAGGSITLDGQELLSLPERKMRTIRGGRIGMIFQEPMTSLNPVMPVGTQITEALRLHRGLTDRDAREEASGLLARVGIPEPERGVKDYPFRFSGGMKQRVVIAMALAGQPELLIADEPTTALDVTIQAQVLGLMRKLQEERGLSLLLITHDLGVVAQMAHRLAVMYAGEIVETASRERFFAAPAHPYSRLLLEALPGVVRRGKFLPTIPGTVPRLDRDLVGCRFAPRCPYAMEVCKGEAPGWTALDTGHRVRCHLFGEQGSETGTGKNHGPAPDSTPPSAARETAQPLLQVSGLKVHFPVRRGVLQRVAGHVKAVDGVSLDIRTGETLALVGESGCGKTTVGKAILQLQRPTSGEVSFEGARLDAMSRRALRPLRREFQIVFQDPYGSLDPRMRVGEVLEEGLQALRVEGDRKARRLAVDALLERMGLPEDAALRYPHEFSGGQRQRIAIARALAVNPKLIVCDEPTSALDVSVQAQILNLLRELQRERKIGYLFITHNLGVVGYLAHRVAVMYLGRIVEEGSVDTVLSRPAHPYTQALLASVPKVSGAGIPAAIGGDAPSPQSPPSGCHFRTRCPHAMQVCEQTYPESRTVEPGQHVRCHLY
jgi:peptide/nickel transport system ATP-binding protein